MPSLRWVSLVFAVAAVYDGILGLGFLFAADALLRSFAVTPPNHPGYLQFIAALLIVFGLMFAALARNPIANRNCIPYGILLKVAYCAVAFFHWFAGNLPVVWKPMAVIDLLFLPLFFWAYKVVTKPATA